VTGGSSAYSGPRWWPSRLPGAARLAASRPPFPRRSVPARAHQVPGLARGQQKPTSAAAAAPAPPPAVSRPSPRSAGRGGGIIERAACGLDRGQRRSPCDCFSSRRTRNIIRRSLSSTPTRANMASKPAARHLISRAAYFRIAAPI